MAPRLSALILAAGLSSRMGELKALLPLNGRTMLGQGVALFSAFGVDDIVVVTGHRAGEIGAAATEAGARLAHNPDHAAGMYGSIRTGAAALAGRCDGFFLLPVDMPLVRCGTVRLLAASFAGQPALACCPVFAGRRGHPPLIHADLIASILAQEHPEGGMRGLLAQIEAVRPDQVREVPVADAHIHLDLDTPEAYRDGCARFASRGIPTMAECMTILEHLHPMPGKGLAHGRAVAGVAAAIAEAMNRHGGRTLDVELCRVGGWLHDIAKGQPRHEAEGECWLRKLGFERAAAIVGVHKDLPWRPGMEPGEREIVFLADKLVRGSRLVAIEARFAEKLSLFRHEPEAVRAIERRWQQAEQLAAALEAAMGQPLAGVATTADGVGRDGIGADGIGAGGTCGG
ncbi:DVU_1551 family NTP transferase [Desulfobulbus sp.]|uniref:DVU_1551 family NTP transferase n=1 Tax=Desulfobulbus sp. TaxID=895 RepID=UPI00286EE7E6|nr:NTP transferase domain-containing protein [Desulfobulbus sp.]